jgi:hypothetical protein
MVRRSARRSSKRHRVAGRGGGRAQGRARKLLAARAGDLGAQDPQWRRRVGVFVYFNNDWEAFAVRNGLWLARALGVRAGGG